MLERNHEPILGELHGIAAQLATRHPELSRKESLKIIRRWFRKRREEMSNRLFQQFRVVFNLAIGVPIPRPRISEILHMLEANNGLIDDLVAKSGVYVKEVEVARGFVLERARNYLKRHGEELKDVDY